MRNALLAAALSLALHAVGLAIFLTEAGPTVVAVARPREQPVQIEVMRLAGLVAPPAKAPPITPAAKSPTPAAPRGDPAPRPSAAPEPSPSAAPEPSPSATPEPGPSATPEPGPAGSEPAQGGGEGDPAPGEAGSSAPGPAAEEAGASQAPLDTTALSRRLQQVALRCYPAAARRFRQTGEAQIRFCLDPAGALRESTVLRSTGSALLDHAATDCVVPGAAPFGPETFGRCFAVPVRFNP